ncbi:chaperone modulator CbpM [Megalodesulfovibrio paquesii]
MDIERFAGGPPAKSQLMAWAEFLEATAVHPSRIGELMELGWICPQRTTSGDYLFLLRDVYRIRKLERLLLDFEMSTIAGVIVVDLLERVETLESRVRHYEKLINMP